MYIAALPIWPGGPRRWQQPQRVEGKPRKRWNENTGTIEHAYTIACCVVRMNIATPRVPKVTSQRKCHSSGTMNLPAGLPLLHSDEPIWRMTKGAQFHNVTAKSKDKVPSRQWVRTMNAYKSMPKIVGVAAQSMAPRFITKGLMGPLTATLRHKRMAAGPQSAAHVMSTYKVSNDSDISGPMAKSAATTGTTMPIHNAKIAATGMASPKDLPASVSPQAMAKACCNSQ
mmetsp:Transcript_17611/g.50096  ORF Transcript_17611/g.50096 Transcript_17611/m.50096 type:complete len:228 (-) Transcript_17611:419-1102(-)